MCNNIWYLFFHNFFHLLLVLNFLELILQIHIWILPLGPLITLDYFSLTPMHQQAIQIIFFEILKNQCFYLLFEFRTHNFSRTGYWHQSFWQKYYSNYWWFNSVATLYSWNFDLEFSESFFCPHSSFHFWLFSLGLIHFLLDLYGGQLRCWYCFCQCLSKIYLISSICFWMFKEQYLFRIN